MSNYLKQKVKLLSFVAVIFIVLVNSYNYDHVKLTGSSTITEGFNFSAMFQYFISNGIASFAVPLIFLIFGFVFFKHFEPTVKGYFNKLKYKFIPLLTTFLSWSLLATGIVFVCSNIDNLKNLPYITMMLSKFNSYGIASLLISPPDYQLWILLNFLIIIIYSPIVYILLRYCKFFVIIPLAVIWITDINIGISVEALLFFVFGGYLSIYVDEKYHTGAIETNTRVTGIIVWLILCIVKTYWAATFDINKDYLSGTGLLILHKLSVLLGVFVVWYFCDFLIVKLINKKKIMRLTWHSSMIFLIHEPLMTICNQFAFLSSQSDITHTVLFFGFSISIIALSIVISMLIYHFSPLVHKYFCGGLSK